ncbi:MAG: DNA polymerase III subunit delta', partial [Pseudomonadales bacterium]|nr:DNA polymerase III subunit delta' [Pseudomonadales bacterium]
MSTDNDIDCLPWHNPMLAELLDQRSRAALHPSLLIVAPEYAGKQRFAKALAARLLCQQLNTSIEPAQPCGECRGCELFQAATHPDYYRLAVAADRKTIGVDDVRALLQSLQLAAQIGGARVAVIGPAESLTENAANALLKALEEPGSDTYFMLLSQTARAVLPTIASRSQRIVLGLPSQASLATWLARSVEGSSKAAVANAVQRARV